MGIYEELVAKSPSNVEALAGLARMLERKGAVDEAIRVAGEAIKHEGDTFAGHKQLVEILMRHERYEEAAKAAVSCLEGLGEQAKERACPKCGKPLGGQGWRCNSCRAWLNEC